MTVVEPSSADSGSQAVALLSGLTAAFCFIHLRGIPLAEIFLGLWMLVVLGRTLRKEAPCPAPIPILTVLFCWIAISFARSLEIAALKDVAQAGIILGIAPCMFRQVRRCSESRRAVSLGIVTGALLSMAVAAAQYANNSPAVDVRGLAANRPLYGVLLAIGAPFVLTAIRNLGNRWQIPGQVLFVLIAVTTVLHAGALALFVIAIVAWLVFKGAKQDQVGIAATLVFASICIFTNLGPRPNLKYLGASMATHKDGLTRRWVVEFQAAIAAIKDAPIMGRGPGNYQHIVSGANYRTGLPEPAENRVDPGAQCGYLTIAVTSGLPAVILLIASLALALRSGMNSREVAISTALILPALAFTPLLVQGAGVLLGAMLGMRREEAGARTSPAKWPAHAAGCAVAVAFGLTMFHFKTPANETPTPNRAVAKEKLIIVEAESAAATPHFQQQNDETASSRKLLRLIGNDKAKLRDAEPAVCRFSCPKAGIYHCWFRAWWNDGCGNSLRAGIDEQRPELVGNDGTYKTWHWVRGHAVELEPGEHRLVIQPTEIGIKLDQIVFSSSADYYPDGIVNLSPPVEPPKTIATKPQTTLLPPPRALTEPTTKPFLAATGGAYLLGPEAFFCEMGIPYDRLEQCETAKIDVLRKYDLVYLNGSMIGFKQRPLYEALLRYVEEGGALILEKFIPVGKSNAEMKVLGQVVGFSHSPVTINADNSFLFKDFAGPKLLHKDIRIDSVVRYGDAERFGKVTYKYKTRSKRKKSKQKTTPRERNLGPALIHKRVGKGHVWINVLPLGFTSMWRSRDFDQIAYNLLNHIIKGRHLPIYQRIQRPALASPVVMFSDDFMRVPGKMGGWSVESGSFRLTGPQKKWSTDAFQCAADQPGRMTTGNPNWNDYCLTASILTNKGGIWAETSDGKKLILQLDGDDVVLLKEADDSTKELSRTTLTGNQSGWRRLSLLARKGRWEGFVDGVRRANQPTKHQLKGHFGLIANASHVRFDDVRACATALILPNTDRTLGEEGGPICIAPTNKGLEPRTVYAASWYMYPDPYGRNAIQMAMPPLQGATLLLNGKPANHIQATVDPPLVPLPKGMAKNDSFNMICTGWRDYMFGPQMTDWYGVGALWSRTSRWSCSPSWEWLGARTKEKTTLWHRHPLKPPYAMTVYAASASEFKYGKEVGRDLNLVLAGDGVGPESGLVLHIGPASIGCELRRDGKVIARNRTIGMPRGHELHHRWFELKVIAEPKRVRCFYERHPIFDHKLQEELPTGYVGFWTYRNSVRIARATLATSSP